ncbi:MAG: C13 family peptidase [Acidobacteriota bacterium]
MKALAGLVAVLLALIAVPRPAAAQSSHLLVIVGLAGEPAIADEFHRWASTIIDAARQRYGLPAESVIYLGEDPARDALRITDRSTSANIQASVEKLVARARPGDRVFIVLIGHGAAAAGAPRFNLPGPDLAAKDFAALLDRFTAQSVTLVNTASASGGFVATLSGRDRTIITATRTDGERNQARFGEFFAEALGGTDGDIDKDGRVSMLEAFTWARRRVEESYKKEGQLLTEHAMLDDDGDGKGSDALDKPGGDGALARTQFLAAASAEPASAESIADPALRQLYTERRALEDAIASLKAGKGKMDESEYARELERLLVELARKSREIREKEKK